MKLLTPLLGTALLLFSLTGCDILNSSASSDEIVIAALYNLTGSQSSLDIPSSRGAQLAIDEVNANGGVLGKRVRLLIEDGRTDPRYIESMTSSVINRNPNLSAIFGFSDTDQVLAAAPVAAAAGIPFITSGATSPELPEEVPNDLFLACFGDNVQAAAAAEWAYQTLGARTVSILHNGESTYAKMLQGFFRRRFEELGGTVVSSREYTLSNISDKVAEVQSADLIFLSATPVDAVEGSLAIRRANISTPILGGDGFDEPSAWAAHPDLNDIYFTTHAYLGADNPDAQVQAFRTAYIDTYGEEPTAFAALGYDTARLILNAITTSGSASPNEILNALATTENFEGVTGSISYQNGGRIPIKSVSIFQISSGSEIFVAEVIPQQVPAP